VEQFVEELIAIDALGVETPVYFERIIIVKSF
jgi:hypothetical protein